VKQLKTQAITFHSYRWHWSNCWSEMHAHRHTTSLYMMFLIVRDTQPVCIWYIFHGKSLCLIHTKTFDVVNSKAICKLTASSVTIRHDDWHSVEDAELMAMSSWTSRVVPDGLPKIPKPSELNLRRPNFKSFSLFDPELAQSAEKVSRNVKEVHGGVSEHREDMPKHPDLANSSFGNPSVA